MPAVEEVVIDVKLEAKAVLALKMTSVSKYNVGLINNTNL